MLTDTARPILRKTPVFLTAGILFVCGAAFNGCSPDKDVNPTGGASVNLPVLNDDYTPALPAPQPQADANEKENFHIYLAFGQSNMEGQNPNYASDFTSAAATKYKQNVNKRFRVMTAVAGSYKIAGGTENRKQGEWYTAVPPLIRNNLGLSPADYFGRTLVAGIADTNIKIGIIAVAVAGCAIEGLEKGSSASNYFNSLTGTIAQVIKPIAAIYDNSPYTRLVTLAKEAQKVGVIKGVIMHQGESGAAGGNGVWAQKVKGIYDNLLSDLGLPANSIPFLVGEPVITASDPNQNNATLIRGITNTMKDKLPGGEPVAHVIPSNGCTDMGDNLHFSYDGYEKLGIRYGEKMLELNYKNKGPTSIAPAKR